MTVVVTRGDTTVLHRSWGHADVEAQRAVDSSTTFQTGSVAKQFTAVLTLQLVDRGRIALDDTLGRYLSGLKPEWTGLRIGQLLNHTSGAPREYRDPSRISEAMPTDSLLAIARQSKGATEMAGAKFIYSNTGYMLLAALVERLHRKPFGDVVRDEIARPLSLRSLSYCADVQATAKGYHQLPNQTLTAAPFMHPSFLLGSGGICTSAADLARWNRALHTGTVLSAASYAAMVTPRGAAATANVPYGFGLYIRDTPGGGTVVVHDGSTAGYSAENVWYPRDQLSITMLYNRSPSLGANLNLTEAMGRVVLQMARSTSRW